MGRFDYSDHTEVSYIYDSLFDLRIPFGEFPVLPLDSVR